MIIYVVTIQEWQVQAIPEIPFVMSQTLLILHLY